VLSSARRRTLALALASSAAAAAQLVATPAASAAGPAALCAELGDLGLTRGACASSVATSGATSEDDIVPSGAAYIANCKRLEATDFVKDGARPYPYQFYKGLLDTPEGAELFFPGAGAAVSANYLQHQAAFVAANRAGCVRVLRGLHSGALFDLLLASAPQAAP
jgi:hypothetical protein